MHGHTESILCGPHIPRLIPLLWNYSSSGTLPKRPRRGHTPSSRRSPRSSRDDNQGTWERPPAFRVQSRSCNIRWNTVQSGLQVLLFSSRLLQEIRVRCALRAREVPDWMCLNNLTLCRGSAVGRQVLCSDSVHRRQGNLIVGAVY